MKRLTLKNLMLTALLAASLVNVAQAAPERIGHWIGGTSAGFGVAGSEGFFLTDLAADYFLDPNMSVGYETLFMVGDFFGWGNQIVGKYTFDIHEDNFRDLTPYIEALMGFVIASNGDTTAGFLGGFGFGADYYVRSRWALGTNMIFDFGNDISDENFVWLWKIFTVKYVF